jgi:hypothetical protein
VTEYDAPELFRYVKMSHYALDFFTMYISPFHFLGENISFFLFLYSSSLLLSHDMNLEVDMNGSFCIALERRTLLRLVK